MRRYFRPHSLFLDRSSRVLLKLPQIATRQRIFLRGILNEKRQTLDIQDPTNSSCTTTVHVGYIAQYKNTLLPPVIQHKQKDLNQ